MRLALMIGNLSQSLSQSVHQSMPDILDKNSLPISDQRQVGVSV